MDIVMKPTRRKETFNGVQYRIYEGSVPGLDNLRLEFLGMFRIFGTIEQKERFERAVGAVSAGDPPVITLITDAGLSNP